MATTKVTFTFDQATVARLNNAAEHRQPEEIVREAIHDYHERIGKLSESEECACWPFWIGSPNARKLAPRPRWKPS